MPTTLRDCHRRRIQAADELDVARDAFVLRCGGGQGDQSLSLGEIARQHPRHGVVVQHHRLARLEHQGALVGGARIRVIARLVIGNTQGGKEGPVAGLQLHGTVQEVAGVTCPALLDQHLAVFAHHAGIVRGDQHQLAEHADRSGIVALRALELGLLDAGVDALHHGDGRRCRLGCAGRGRAAKKRGERQRAHGSREAGHGFCLLICSEQDARMRSTKA